MRYLSQAEAIIFRMPNVANVHDARCQNRCVRPTWLLQVRTAAAGIVQLQYGEDGRDPMVMEGDGGDPVDFDR